MRVLVLGDQRSKSRFTGFEDVEFFDDPDPDNGPYDYIVLDHLLQQAKRPQVLQIVRMYSNALVENGQLALIMPSLEWACREIAKDEEPNPMAYLSIYGTDEEPYLCGMTMVWMRLVMEQSSLLVVKANVEHYTATLNEQSFNTQQNVVIGMKITDSPSDVFSYACAGANLEIAG